MDQLPQECLFSQLLCRSTPKLQLRYGTVMEMLWFNSLVKYQTTAYINDQTTDFVHVAFIDYFFKPFSPRIFYSFK